MTEHAKGLLEHLRAALHEPGLGYAEPLTPISGGYDTRIFGFGLRGAPPSFATPLILRVLDRRYPPVRALSERATQNAVAGLGYPAPRVVLASADPTILGGAFLVMERLSGRPLLDVRRIGVAPVLVETQLQLHALDANVLLEALDREGPPISREAITFEGHLSSLERRIARGPLHGLERAMTRLSDHRPPDDAERVILGLVPVGLMGVPSALRGIVEIARRILVARYVAAYRRRKPLDAGRLAYYEAMACMRGLVRTTEARLAAQRESGLNPLDASTFGERLSARFARLTGVAPSLPASPS